MSLVVKKVRAQKYVGILSTIHHELTVVEKTKTQAHMFYNAGKGGSTHSTNAALLRHAEGRPDAGVWQCSTRQ